MQTCAGGVCKHVLISANATSEKIVGDILMCVSAVNACRDVCFLP